MNNIRLIYITIILMVATTIAISLTQSFQTINQQTSDNLSQTKNLQQSFGQLPLLFVENQGQWDDQVAYAVQGSDKTLYFTPEGITFALTAPVEEGKDNMENGRTQFAPHRLSSKPARIQRYTVKLDFLGANPNVQPIGQEQDNATISYFKGQPDDWKTRLPSYRRIVYPNLWPGIDLIYEGTVNHLKYHFLVHPGADPNQIRLAYRGATTVTINDAGKLLVETPLGGFEDDTPVAFQEIDGERVPVDMAYMLEKETAESQPYHFIIGKYDPEQPLLLDPAILVYSGYIGGNGGDTAYGIAVDNNGNAYITGATNSTETTFPVTVGPDLSSNGNADAFVVKLNANGTTLVYAGYIGGSESDGGYYIAVDAVGNAYVTGTTLSDEATFPVIVGPDLTYNGGDMDVFVAKINQTGTALDYAGYIGGLGSDTGYGIAVTEIGNAYIAGYTNSSETTFPVMVGPDLTYNGGNWDAFVAKVNLSGSGLDYAGFIGGDSYDYAHGIDVDESGNAFLVGYTTSDETTFPVMVGPDLSYNGNTDVFVVKVNMTGNALDFAGYIGGDQSEYGYGIALDGQGNSYVTGVTNSGEATFPVSIGPILTYSGGGDAFIGKVNSLGNGLVYAGYIGGEQSDVGFDIAVDNNGNAFIVGTTSSNEATFPVSTGPDLTFNGISDGFISVINPSGNSLISSGYVGGSSQDIGFDIAVDSIGNPYIVGSTSSDNSSFPIIAGPDLTYNGSGDGFITKIALTVGSPQTITIDGPNTGLSGTSYSFTSTISPATIIPPLTYTWQATGQPPITNTGGLTDTAVFTWNITGPKLITVTTSNVLGTVTNTHTITLYEAVSADFTGSPTTGNTPLPVTFTNLSSGSFITCLWDFGDAGTSTKCNPTNHTFTIPGLFTVSLTITGPGGTDTITKTDYITVNYMTTTYLPAILNP